MSFVKDRTFCEAVTYGYIKEFKKLLTPAVVNEDCIDRDRKVPPLVLATKRGDWEMVQMLLDAGADLARFEILDSPFKSSVRYPQQNVQISTSSTAKGATTAEFFTIVKYQNPNAPLGGKYLAFNACDGEVITDISADDYEKEVVKGLDTVKKLSRGEAIVVNAEFFYMGQARLWERKLSGAVEAIEKHLELLKEQLDRGNRSLTRYQSRKAGKNATWEDHPALIKEEISLVQNIYDRMKDQTKIKPDAEYAQRVKSIQEKAKKTPWIKVVCKDGRWQEQTMDGIYSPIIDDHTKPLPLSTPASET